MKNGNIFQDLSIVSEKSRKVQIWKCSESGQIFLLLQALCCSPESLDKPEPKGPFGLCYWFLPALILFATNHRQHLKRTSTRSSPIKDSAVQDPVRELQSATSELLSLSLQRVSLGRPCNTSVLQSLVCNTVVIIAGAPCNPYRLFSYRLQQTLTAVLRINHLSAKSQLSAHAKNLTSYNLLIHIEQADSPNPEKKNLKKE